MTARCAVYIRVSITKQEEKGFSLDWERKNLLEIAKPKKRKVGKNDIYDEGGQSGETIVERPQFQKLLGNAGKGKYDIVLVSELERLSRAQYSKDWGIIGDTFRSHHVKVATPYQTFDIKVRRGWFESYYRCHARWSGHVCKNSRRIRTERIEPIVLRLIDHIVNFQDIVKNIYQNLSDALNSDMDESGEKLKQLERQLKDLEAGRKNLISQVEKGNLQGVLIAERLHEIEKREKNLLEEKESILKALKTHSKRFISFEEYSDLRKRFLESFRELSDEEKRKIVEFHIQKIE